MKLSLDIRTKLTGLCFGAIGSLSIALTIWFQHSESTRLHAALETEAKTYAALVSREVETAVAFDDQETAREVSEAIALDHDVQAIAIYAENGRFIGGVGEGSSPPKSVARGVTVSSSKSRVTAHAPIVSREGPRGTLVVDLSTASIEAEQRRILRASLAALLLTLLFGFGGAFFIGGSLSKRLRRIQSATREVAAGNLSHAPVLVDASSDEVGLLARDFNSMAKSIRDLVESIESTAASEHARLEVLVTARTRELTLRNADMRRLLDTVEQGFFTTSATGEIAHERSAILERWFGEVRGAETIWKYLGRVDRRVSAPLEVGFAAIADDMMPLEITIDQLPRTIETSGSVYRLDYRPITVGEVVERIVVVVSDVTAETARQKAEAAQRELASLCSRLLQDPASVQEFHAEGVDLVRALGIPASEETLPTLKRTLHTLKGNAAFFGQRRLSSACHELETVLAETGEVPRDRASTVTSLFAELSRTVSALAGEPSDAVALHPRDLREIADAVTAGAPRIDISRSIRRLNLEPVERRLTRLAEEACVIAARLGKPTIKTVVEPNGVRLDHARWGAFWSTLTHVVRNAVDHGIESKEERVALGKPGEASIIFRAYDHGVHHVIEIADDGRGIDWDALARRAARMGIAGTVAREDLLFVDGLSTADDVTDVSGRGVGLSAVRVACNALGGTIDVTTESGKGTRFTFRIPSQSADRLSLAPIRAGRASPN